MSRIKPYNFEKYSIVDICNYLHEKGYSTKKSGMGFTVVGTDVFVDIPTSSGLSFIFADIRIETAQPLVDPERSKKLFRLLSKKFGKKADEKPRFIKDFDHTIHLWDDRYRDLWRRSRQQRIAYYGDTGQEID